MSPPQLFARIETWDGSRPRRFPRARGRAAQDGASLALDVDIEVEGDLDLGELTAPGAIALDAPGQVDFESVTLTWPRATGAAFGEYRLYRGDDAEVDDATGTPIARRSGDAPGQVDFESVTLTWPRATGAAFGEYRLYRGDDAEVDDATGTPIRHADRRRVSAVSRRRRRGRRRDRHADPGSISSR